MIFKFVRGFTLIELMIVVAIVAILSSVAYPSYIEYVRHGARAEAQVILLETAQFLERNYTEANKYDKDAAGTDIQLPFTVSPKSGTAKYTIGFSAIKPVTASTYKIEATPAVSGMMAADKCGTLGLDYRGNKTVSGTGTTVAECWR